MERREGRISSYVCKRENKTAKIGGREEWKIKERRGAEGALNAATAMGKAKNF